MEAESLQEEERFGQEKDLRLCGEEQFPQQRNPRIQGWLEVCDRWFDVKVQERCY